MSIHKIQYVLSRKPAAFHQNHYAPVLVSFMIRQYVCGAGKVIIRQVIVTTGFYFNQQKMHRQISSYITCVWKMMS